MTSGKMTISLIGTGGIDNGLRSGPSALSAIQILPNRRDLRKYTLIIQITED